jgi:hypothetical protein
MQQALERTLLPVQDSGVVKVGSWLACKSKAIGDTALDTHNLFVDDNDGRYLVMGI